MIIIENGIAKLDTCKCGNEMEVIDIELNIDEGIIRFITNCENCKGEFLRKMMLDENVLPDYGTEYILHLDKNPPDLSTPRL